MFPEAELLLGVDIVIPYDFTYLKQNKQHLRGDDR